MNETGYVLPAFNRNDADYPLESFASPARLRSRRASNGMYDEHLSSQQQREKRVINSTIESLKHGNPENADQDNNPHASGNMCGTTYSSNSISCGLPDVTVSALTIPGSSPQLRNSRGIHMGASLDALSPTVGQDKNVVISQGHQDAYNELEENNEVTSNKDEEKTKVTGSDGSDKRKQHIMPVGYNQEATPMNAVPGVPPLRPRLVDDKTGGCSGLCAPRMNVSFLHGFRGLFKRKKKKSKGSCAETDTVTPSTRGVEVEEVIATPAAAVRPTPTSTTDSTHTQNVESSRIVYTRRSLQQQSKAQDRYQDATMDLWSEDERLVGELVDVYGIHANREDRSGNVTAAETDAAKTETAEHEGQITPTIHSLPSSHPAASIQNEEGLLVPTPQVDHVSGLTPVYHSEDEDANMNSGTSLCFFVEEDCKTSDYLDCDYNDDDDDDNNNNNNNECHSEEEVESLVNIRHTESSPDSPLHDAVMEVPTATMCKTAIPSLSTTAVLTPSPSSLQQRGRQLQGERCSQSASVPLRKEKQINSTPHFVSGNHLSGVRGRSSGDNDKNNKNTKRGTNTSDMSLRTASVTAPPSPQRNVQLRNGTTTAKRKNRSKQRGRLSGTHPTASPRPSPVEAKGNAPIPPKLGHTLFRPSTSVELRARQRQKQGEEKRKEEGEEHREESKKNYLGRRGTDNKKARVSMTSTSFQYGDDYDHHHLHHVKNRCNGNDSGGVNGVVGTVRSAGGGSYAQLAAKKREYLNTSMNTTIGPACSHDSTAPPLSAYSFTAPLKVSQQPYVADDGLERLTPAQWPHSRSKECGCGMSILVKGNSNIPFPPRRVPCAGLTWREFKVRFYNSERAAKFITTTASGYGIVATEPVSETEEQHQRREEKELAASVRPSCAACSPDAYELLLLRLLHGTNEAVGLVTPIREELYEPPPRQESVSTTPPVTSVVSPPPRENEGITVNAPRYRSAPALSSHSQKVNDTTPIANHTTASSEHDSTPNTGVAKIPVVEEEMETEEEEEDVCDQIEKEVPLNLYSPRFSKTTLDSPCVRDSAALSLPVFAPAAPYSPNNYRVEQNAHGDENDTHAYDAFVLDYQKGREKERQQGETKSTGEIPGGEKCRRVNPIVIAGELGALDAVPAHRPPSIPKTHSNYENKTLTVGVLCSEENINSSGVTLPAVATAATAVGGSGSSSSGSGGGSGKIKPSADRVVSGLGVPGEEEDDIPNPSAINTLGLNRTISNSNNTVTRGKAGMCRPNSNECDGVRLGTKSNGDMDMQSDEKTVTQGVGCKHNADAALEAWLDERQLLEEKLIAVSAERNLLADQLRICNLYDTVKKLV